MDAFTVCIDFDDYLEHTLGRMLETFDRVAVVTTAEDRATQALTAKLGALTVISDKRNYLGEVFNLPALANDGYRALKPTGWAAKIDPDILLPAGARAQLQLEERCLYGAQRWFCETPAILRELERTNDRALLEPPYETSTDVLGFLQLFHVRSPAMAGRAAPYEDARFEGPSRSNDRLFSQMWPPELHRRLPFDVVHLGLDAIGTNWKGRKAPSFRG